MIMAAIRSLDYPLPRRASTYRHNSGTLRTWSRTSSEGCPCGCGRRSTARPRKPGIPGKGREHPFRAVRPQVGKFLVDRTPYSDSLPDPGGAGREGRCGAGLGSGAVMALCMTRWTTGRLRRCRRGPDLGQAKG